MKTHDVQSVSIAQPARVVFDYVAKPENLPKWTNAFPPRGRENSRTGNRGRRGSDRPGDEDRG